MKCMHALVLEFSPMRHVIVAARVALEGGRPLLDYCCVLVLKEEAATATGSPAFFNSDSKRHFVHCVNSVD